MVPLEEIISGIFSLILIIVFITIGIKIILKYKIGKKRALIFMGLAWIGLSQLWWSSFLNVFFVLANISSTGLTPVQYVIFSVAFIPLTGFCYVTAITDLILERAQHYLQAVAIIFGGFFEILFLYSIISGNTSMFLTKKGAYYVRNSSLSITLMVLFLAFFLLLGMIFAIQTFKSDNPEIRLKGKFLIIAYVTFSFGAVIDMLPFPLLNYIERLVAMISAVIFYSGFTMPEWIKKLFLKSIKE